MRKIFFAIFAFVCFHSLASCEKAPEITLFSPTSIDVSAQGGVSSISFTTNTDWTVHSSDSWVSVYPSSGTATEDGKVNVKVNCKANTTYEGRSATITISAKDITQTVKVNQPANLGLIVPNKLYELTGSATIQVAVQSNVQYEVFISDDWITQAGTKGLVTDKLMFDVKDNDTYDARSANIVIKALEGEIPEQVIVVKQAQRDAILIDQAKYDMPYGGGEIQVKVQANVEFDVKPNVDWIQYVETKAMSNSTVRLIIDENKTYSSREGRILVSQQKGSISYEIIVKQTGRIAVTSITLNKSEMTLETGSSEMLVATVKPDNATDRSVSWSSSDPSIAVAEKGKVTGVSPGTAIITARAGNRQATCTVTCVPPHEGSSEPGLYLGVQGFNEDLYTLRIQKLDDGTVSVFNTFIDGLTSDIGTLLYYSADNAIDRLKNTVTPSDLVNVAMLTFTDGLDEGSVSKKYRTDGYLYPSNSSYSSAIHSRIIAESVSGLPIVAYTIGLQGSDVTDLAEFRSNLKGLASTDANAFEVSNMEEVNEKFHEIASQLNERNYVQRLHIHIPEPAPNTRVRFSFDNVTSATSSKLYIEGNYDMTNAALTNVVYKGMTCSSGSTVQGRIDGIFVDFTFADVYTDNNALITKDYVKEWKYNSSNGTWGVNSEFNKDTGFDTEYTRRSALIILNLDCSSSLGSDFSNLKKQAKSFIKKLVEGLKIVNAGGGNNGTPKAVDLGLSVKWATMNVGATKPEEYGDYFAWGETAPKTTYNWSTYKFELGTDDKGPFSKYVTNSSYGTVDYKTVLDPEDDAAHVNWGGSWRMPTDAEWTELRTKCTWTWTTQNGVNGRLVTGPNGKSIFLPAAGYRGDTYLYSAGSYGFYWYSSLYTDYPYIAWGVYFNSDYVGGNGYRRYSGQSVRPVFDDPEVPVSSVSLNSSTLTLTVAESKQLTATVLPSTATNKRVIWSSSNPSVASVDNDGLVKGVKAGAATITVTTENGGKHATCAVTVNGTPAYQYVDLGLPSGLKWATFNVGATKPEEYGDYFAWGETKPKTTYNWSTYKFELGTNSKGPFSKYVTKSSYGTVDKKTVLDPEDDAAHVNWGGSWRMPTDAEWTELRTKCTWTWTSQNGVNGRKVTGPNGNSIFLPAAGYRRDSNLKSAGSGGLYWSSSLSTDRPGFAWYVSFYSDIVGRYDDYRYFGQPVRPVSE